MASCSEKVALKMVKAFANRYDGLRQRRQLTEAERRELIRLVQLKVLVVR